MPPKSPQPTLSQLADMCLEALVRDPEQLATFMGATGLSPDGLRRAVGSASLARGLLDYVVQNEPLLLAVCSAHALQPETVMRVWARHNAEA